MVTTDPANPTRLQELLADRATQPLARPEQDELGRLLDAHPGVDPWALDRTAAAIDLAHIEPEPMPATLRRHVQDGAIAWLAESRGIRRPEPMPRSVWWPWLLAAASVLLAVVGWWPRSTSVPSAAAEHARLARLTSPVSWSDVGETGIGGDIVWDNATQTGVMRFTGLDVNDPAKLQYQLWIFDTERGQLTTEAGDAFNAIDGGVFDVETADGEVYVRVAAKLEVFEPELFAVTTEPPGGVVRHIDTDEYRIILAASPAADA